MQLHDSFVIDGVRKTSDGYLTAYAKVARTGVQTYRGHELGRPDLDKVRVYRPPEEVFHADAMRSAAHRPVTLKHPPVPVTSKNWRRFAGGQTGDEVVRDGDFVKVPLVMMDAAMIDAYERDGIKELSLGYSTDIKWRTGVTDAGEEYDAVQTAIRVNHLALVPVARGGDQLRIGDMSSVDDGKTCPNCGAEMHGSKCSSCDYTKDGEYTMKLVIDGLSVTVADDQSGTIIEKHISKLSTDLKSVTDSFEDFKKKAKKDEDEKDKAVKDAQTALSAKDGEIAVLKKQVADAAITPEKLDVLVKARADVITRAKPLVGDQYVFDGKTVEQIRKDAVVAGLGDEGKTMDDATVIGAFTALTKDAKPGDSAAQLADATMRRPHGGTHVVDAREKALADRDAALSNAWKPQSAA